MELSGFAERATAIEREPGDRATVGLVAALLEDAGPDLPVVVRFLQGRVFPAHSGTTLDAGPSLCHEALARAAGVGVGADEIERRLADTGEIGAVAADLDLGGQRGLSAFAGDGPDDLTVAEVDEQLRAVADAAGDGSEDRKRDLLFDLFNRAESEEAKLLARLVLGEMRIGVGEGTIRDAVAAAFLDDEAGSRGDGAGTSETDPGGSDDAKTATLGSFVGADGDGGKSDADDAGDDSDTDGESDDSDTDDADDASEGSGPAVDPDEAAVAVVERALQVTNDAGRVAELAREEGRSGLAEVGLVVGRPVQAMLAQSGTVSGALADWGAAVVEMKFDGARVQVHHDPDGETRAFSRNLEDVTAALPEVVETVEAALSVPAILDGEVVAVDDAGRPQPFQEVLRRFRRKHDVARLRETVPVEFRAFDCLHADGVDLLDAPTTERHARLEELLGDDAATATVSDDPEEIEAIEAAALEAGHEGLMLKAPDAAYTPGQRGRNWRKRKPDVETLDLVVVGAEWGEGRRATLLGTFLLGARSADGDGFETVGKVATGITDERLAELTELLDPEIVAEDGAAVELRPSVVFEVGYEEIQTSPTYSSGYALRFPRFVAVREDVDPGAADSVERIDRLADDGG